MSTKFKINDIVIVNGRAGYFKVEKIVKGVFKDTQELYLQKILNANGEEILTVDGDWYDSTRCTKVTLKYLKNFKNQEIDRVYNIIHALSEFLFSLTPSYIDLVCNQLRKLITKKNQIIVCEAKRIGDS